MQAFEFGAGDFLARRIALGIDGRPDAQAGGGCRVGDQFNEHLVTDQRFAALVHGDVRKHPMLDLLPLARPRWKMAERQA